MRNLPQGESLGTRLLCCMCVCVCVCGGGGGGCIENCFKEREGEELGGVCQCLCVQQPHTHPS